MVFTLVQSKTGSTGGANASSVTVTTTATGSGNLLVAMVHVAAATVTITPPTGWTQVGTTQGVLSGTATVAMFYLQNSTSGVTSVVFSFSASCNAAVALEEWSGVATTSALDQQVASQNAKATAAPTGTTAALAAAGELAIWGLGITATTTLTYSSVTNSYVEDTSANAHSTQATQAEATLFYNTSVGAAATSSAATMSATGGTGNTTILAVFKAAATAPVLTTSPTTLSYSAVAGGSSPASQNDTLTNTGGTSSAWTSAITYGSGSGWLAISPTSGTLAGGANTTIAVTCTTGALAAGTYTATITFTATTGGATATIGVTFVVAPTPVLARSPTSLSFSALAGGSNPASQNDTLSETAGTGTAWTSSISYGSGSGWLAISPSSGTLSASGTQVIAFTCTTGALAAATYTATVTCTATTGGATAAVTVSFVVTGAVTYSDYKNTIEPQLVAALNVKGLLNFVQLIGPDTTMASDSWLTSSATDLASTLSGYVRHAFPTGSADISNDSRETSIKALVASIYTADNTAKPIIQGEMGFAAMGPGQSVALYAYGVEMADYAVQLARSGMAALVAYVLDDDMHGAEWGFWQITADTGVPRPWFFPWSLLSTTLVPGSQLYAPAQPASNDLRVLAARAPSGAWTFVLVNRRATTQNVQLIVPGAPVATSTMAAYTYSSAAPLLVDGNGYPLPSGTVTAVLPRGFTVSLAAGSLLILSQATATQATLYDVKRAPLAKRR